MNNTIAVPLRNKEHGATVSWPAEETSRWDGADNKDVVKEWVTGEVVLAGAIVSKRRADFTGVT